MVTGNENAKIIFFCKIHVFVSSSKVDRFTSDQDHIDQQTILHISSDTFHQRKCFVFLIKTDYPGRLHVSAALWSCTYYRYR